MPRAKRTDLEHAMTTAQVAAALDLTPYLVKARIADGALPPATRSTGSGVMLFDAGWLAAAREITASTPARKRRRRTPAPGPVPSPQDVLGHAIGEPGWLPGWDEVVRYFEALSAASDRVDVETAGKSTEGRPYLVVAVSAPENLRPEARQHNRVALERLWDPRQVPDQVIQQSLEEARTVGLVLASQHSNEIGAMLMTMQLAWDLATATDDAMRELLANTLTLLVPTHNPDGAQMIADWYARWLGTPYEGVPMPWLYHPYVGHDNNRDWFMLTQAETNVFVNVHNRERPQAVFDMHQMGRFGPRYMVPPFIDPLDPNQDPVVQQGFAALGAHIAQRLTAAGKAGVVTNAIFDNYSPSLAYGNYHGSVDLLSEAASAKLATTVTLDEADLNDEYGIDPRVRAWNQPLPWKGGEWSIREIVEYNLIAARAFLEHLARNRRQWLTDYLALNRRTCARADKPFAFVFPPDQRDPETTAELMRILQRGLVEVHVAKDSFVADNIRFPPGTYVVRLDQPAGAFAKTLLEVQDYPDLRQWPGGPPRAPYDISGHTLPLQMGVQAIQIDRPLDGELPLALATFPIAWPGALTLRDASPNTWIIDARTNASVRLVRRLLARNVEVYRAKDRDAGNAILPGDYLVPVAAMSETEMRADVSEAGAQVAGAVISGPIPAWRQEPVRLGVYQPWTASIDEGWARWVLEEYGQPYTTLTTDQIRQGELDGRYDVILIPEMSAEDIMAGRPEKTPEKDPYPPEYVGGLGDVGLEMMRRFVANGGTIIATDNSASAIVDALALPVEQPLRDIPAESFSCPGSLLRVVVDNRHPLGLGLPREMAVLFMNSVVFVPGAADSEAVARYPHANPRLSGWMHGEREIQGKSALVETRYGEGRAILAGFRPWFRAQARGTYRVLFNAVFRAGLRDEEFDPHRV